MKRFPFSKRTIEFLPANDMDSPSREAEYTDMEFIGRGAVKGVDQSEIVI